MNRFGFRRGARVIFMASVIASVLMGGCAGRSNRPPTNTPQTQAGRDLDVRVSNGGSGNAAPSGGLRVDLYIFAKDGQNPVNFEYSITNIQSEPILSPVFVTITLPSTNPAELIDAEKDMTVTVPISPYISLVSGNLVTIVAASLKPGESTPTI